MRQRLVPWPGRAAIVAVVCLAIVAAMGIAFHNENHGSAFDDSVDTWLRSHGQPLWKTLIHITDPAKVGVLFAILIIWAVCRRRWRVVALAVATPLLTIVLVEHVLKPWVNRHPYVPPGQGIVVKAIFGGHIPTAYPSGHESGIGSFLAVCGLLVLTSGWSLARRLLALAAVVAVAVVASLTLVGRYYHYATDTIGSMFFCIAMVLVVGLAIDAVASSPGGRGRPRTAHAA